MKDLIEALIILESYGADGYGADRDEFFIWFSGGIPEISEEHKTRLEKLHFHEGVEGYYIFT